MCRNTEVVPAGTRDGDVVGLDEFKGMSGTENISLSWCLWCFKEGCQQIYTFWLESSGVRYKVECYARHNKRSWLSHFIGTIHTVTHKPLVIAMLFMFVYFVYSHVSFSRPCIPAHWDLNMQCGHLCFEASSRCFGDACTTVQLDGSCVRRHTWSQLSEPLWQPGRIQSSTFSKNLAQQYVLWWATIL